MIYYVLANSADKSHDIKSCWYAERFFIGHMRIMVSERSIHIPRGHHRRDYIKTGEKRINTDFREVLKTLNESVILFFRVIIAFRIRLIIITNVRK